MVRAVKAFLADQSGATALEYVLLCALIGLGVIAAITSLGQRVSSELVEVTAGMK